MSSLNINDKQVLEKLLGMKSGYVLNFSDKTFREFFKIELNVDINDVKYSSGSKANRLRRFWQVADDARVGKSIKELITHIETQVLLGTLATSSFPGDLLPRAEAIAGRLLGAQTPDPVGSEDEFIKREFGDSSIERLQLDSALVDVLLQRRAEIEKCLSAKAPLATIFLCGSSLEGILLGVASKRPKEFNQSPLSPKDGAGNVKNHLQWKLSDLINVARDLNLIGEDVKRFSHVLRDFRNYIHPSQQVSSRFKPDVHTAKICLQVLKAAVAQIIESQKVMGLSSD